MRVVIMRIIFIIKRIQYLRKYNDIRKNRCIVLVYCKIEAISFADYLCDVSVLSVSPRYANQVPAKASILMQLLLCLRNRAPIPNPQKVFSVQLQYSYISRFEN